MAQVIFILGAGASVHAGVPVMDSFYNEAIRLKRRKVITKVDEEHFSNIMKVVKSLKRLYSNFSMKPKLSNIETIYGLIEMGNLLEIFPDLENVKEIQNLKMSINKFIVRTLELKTVFMLSRNKEVLSPVAYDELVKLIMNLKEEIRPSVSCCIITFNYDIALDFILHRDFSFSNVNYCLYGNRNNHGIKLLKLHGSINWGVCKKCNEINPLTTVDGPDMRISHKDSREKKFHILMSKKLKNSKCSKCGNAELSELPLIVPPTWNKTEYHVYLNNVWKNAANELSTAEIIVIVGYSMPESDLFFRYLLNLAGIDFIDLTDFIVIDNNPEIVKKFYNLMGTEIRDDRFNLNNSIQSEDFRSGLKHIHMLLKKRYGIS